MLLQHKLLLKVTKDERQNNKPYYRLIHWHRVCCLVWNVDVCNFYMGGCKMVNLINNVKTLLVYTIVILIIGAGSWEVVRRHLYKVPSKEIVVSKPEIRYITNPTTATPQMLLDWSKSPILIDYKFLHATSEFTEVNVLAYDLNKSTEQNIKVPVAQSGNFRLYVEIGGGVLLFMGGGYLAYKYLR
jgi:hypothetical protein